jgi:hypothetical protein
VVKPRGWAVVFVGDEVPCVVLHIKSPKIATERPAVKSAVNPKSSVGWIPASYMISSSGWTTNHNQIPVGAADRGVISPQILLQTSLWVATA